MDKAAPHLSPAVGVIAADDDDIRRHPQIAQGPVQAHRLLSLVGDLGLYDQEIDIAMRACLPTSM